MFSAYPTDPRSWLGSLCIVTLACCHQENVFRGRCLSSSPTHTQTPRHADPANLQVQHLSGADREGIPVQNAPNPGMSVHVSVSHSPSRLHVCTGPPPAEMRGTQPALRSSGPGLSSPLSLGCPPWHFPLPKGHFWWDNTNIRHQLHLTPSLDDLHYWLTQSHFSV